MATFDATTRTNQWSPVRIAAFAVGAVFLLIGVLGFIPGITTDYDSLDWAGHHSEAKLFGIFQVSILHNLVHFAFGFAGVLASRAAKPSAIFLVGGGVIYLVLWLYGLVIDQASTANFVPVNTADNWLHFAIGLAMIVLGLALPRLVVGRRHTGLLN
ncbi:DUF4383 domain-containing protein [Nocardia lijiangensis]|uniref:DUF4383 domain-containing protein n=1 Tax=Nocardia lijiangensis TaxID=299618 RepID=UPI003D73E424